GRCARQAGQIILIRDGVLRILSTRPTPTRPRPITTQFSTGLAMANSVQSPAIERWFNDARFARLGDLIALVDCRPGALRRPGHTGRLLLRTPNAGATGAGRLAGI